MDKAQAREHYTSLLGKIEDVGRRQESTFGEEILCQEFVKVMPIDYKQALAKQATGSR